jgi:hypothetical protein
MKQLTLLLLASLATSLLSTTPVTAGPAQAASAQTGDAPHARTVTALECMLGIGLGRCKTVFAGAAFRIFSPILGPNPYFQTAKYVGPSTSGMMSGT